jgi:hypothetical protein
MTTNQQHAVDFLGYSITTVHDDDGNAYVPLKRLCEILGIDHKWQMKKVKSQEIYDGRVFSVPGKDGIHRKMFCLPLEKMYFWMFLVNASTVRPEIIEKLLDYQEECRQVLRHRQRYGIAINPRMPAAEIETFVRELLDKVLEKQIPEHFDQRLRRQVLFHAELELLGSFSDEPPPYRDKACECIQVSIDRYFDWVAEYERNAAQVTRY